MEIADNARKHGISDEDMLHAARNATHQIPGQPADRIMLIGPACDGTLLEIVVIDPDDDPAVIHAAVLRSKFHRYL